MTCCLQRALFRLQNGAVPRALGHVQDVALRSTQCGCLQMLNKP